MNQWKKEWWLWASMQGGGGWMAWQRKDKPGRHLDARPPLLSPPLPRLPERTSTITLQDPSGSLHTSPPQLLPQPLYSASFRAAPWPLESDSSSRRLCHLSCTTWKKPLLSSPSPSHAKLALAGMMPQSVAMNMGQNGYMSDELRAGESSWPWRAPLTWADKGRSGIIPCPVASHCSQALRPREKMTQVRHEMSNSPSQVLLPRWCPARSLCPGHQDGRGLRSSANHMGPRVRASPTPASVWAWLAVTRETPHRGSTRRGYDFTPSAGRELVLDVGGSRGWGHWVGPGAGDRPSVSLTSFLEKGWASDGKEVALGNARSSCLAGNPLIPSPTLPLLSSTCQPRPCFRAFVLKSPFICGGYVPRPPVDAWNLSMEPCLHSWCFIFYPTYTYRHMIKYNLSVRHRKRLTTIKIK